MFTILKILLFGISIVAGAAVGAVMAVFATFFSCVFIDWAQDAKGGDSVSNVGWVLCFITAPVGFYHGGRLGGGLAALALDALRQREGNRAQTRLDDV